MRKINSNQNNVPQKRPQNAEAHLFGVRGAKLVRDDSQRSPAAFKKSENAASDSGRSESARTITRQIVRDTYSSVIAASGFGGQLPGRDRGQQPGMTTR